MTIFICIIGIILYLFFACKLDYKIFKNRTLKSRKWDLNICCGKTDGKGVNADIQQHKDVPNFVLIKYIYRLPFKDKEFNYVLCSHTIEHVDDPKKFYKELARVGKHVVLLVPPLWDIWGAFFIIWQHKWTFLTIKDKNTKLPKFIPLLFASKIQRIFGQQVTG